MMQVEDGYSSRTRSQSAGAESMRTGTTWSYSAFSPNRRAKGSVLFTGPNGIRDHRVSVEAEHRYVGEGTMSPEGTSDVNYLWRAPQWVPHPRPKTQCVGEIGWGIPQYMDWSTARTGAQTKLGEFRQAVEDRHTHLFQNAWYPGRVQDESPLVTSNDRNSSASGSRSRSRQTGAQDGEQAPASRRASAYSDHSSYSNGSNTNNNNNRGGPPHRYTSLSSRQYW